MTISRTDSTTTKNHTSISNREYRQQKNKITDMKKARKTVKAQIHSQYRPKLKNKIVVKKQRIGARDIVRKIRPLNDTEKTLLSKTMKRLESQTLYGKGLNRTPGGFATATWKDENKDTVEVSLKYGVISEDPRQAKEETIMIDRKTMEPIEWKNEMENGGSIDGKYQINNHGDKPTDYKGLCRIIRIGGKDVQVCYHERNDKKAIGVEVYSGKNHIVGSKDVSYSKKYDEVSDVPVKYKAVVDELIAAHHKKWHSGCSMGEGGKIVYNVIYLDSNGDEIDSTQLDEKDEKLAWSLFKEFGHDKKPDIYLEWEKTTESMANGGKTNVTYEKSSSSSMEAGGDIKEGKNEYVAFYKDKQMEEYEKNKEFQQYFPYGESYVVVYEKLHEGLPGESAYTYEMAGSDEDDVRKRFSERRPQTKILSVGKKYADGGKLDTLRSLIKNELNSHKDENYYGSEDDQRNSHNIYTIAKNDFGYEVDEDESAVDYLLKATPEESWQYWLDVILPKLENKKDMGGILLATAIGAAIGGVAGYGYRDNISSARENAIKKSIEKKQQAIASLEKRKAKIREYKEGLKGKAISQIQRLEEGGYMEKGGEIVSLENAHKFRFGNTGVVPEVGKGKVTAVADGFGNPIIIEVEVDGINYGLFREGHKPKSQIGKWMRWDDENMEYIPLGSEMAKGGNMSNKKVEKVMHEFKHGELKSHGKRVTDRDQAIAIAMSESGQSRKQHGGYMEKGGNVRLKLEAIEKELNEKGVFLKHFGENGVAANATFEGHDIEEYEYEDEHGERHELSKEIQALIDDYNYTGGLM